MRELKTESREYYDISMSSSIKERKKGGKRLIVMHNGLMWELYNPSVMCTNRVLVHYNALEVVSAAMQKTHANLIHKTLEEGEKIF